MRKELFGEEFLEKVLAYDYKGPKEDTVKTYAYINRIKDRCEKLASSKPYQSSYPIGQREVDEYNLGLGRLLKYITLVSSLRELDILLRRDERERLRIEREDLIARK